MNAFAAHNIKHLSPSSLNTWMVSPAVWCVQYLHRIRDEQGSPAAWRGKAVEDGLTAWLHDPAMTVAAASKLAQERFETNALGVADEATDKERACVEAMTLRACDAFADLRSERPLTQLPVEHWIEGIEVPIIGYADFVWPGLIVDLKTTHACPSSAMRPDHLRQVALYSAARGEAAVIYYVTGKKWARFEAAPEDVEAALQWLAKAARSLRRALASTDDHQELTLRYPVNPDDFRLSGAVRDKALELWS